MEDRNIILLCSGLICRASTPLNLFTHRPNLQLVIHYPSLVLRSVVIFELIHKIHKYAQTF